MYENTTKSEKSNSNFVQILLAVLIGMLIGSAVKLVLAEAAEPTAVSTVSVYRLYNPYNGDHHYTTDANEKSVLASGDWDYEGISWKSPVTSSTPTYRLYNPYTGEHHYTTSVNEKSILDNSGWNYEGISWYSDDAHGVPVYRLYNPYKSGPGAHHYTTDANERDVLANSSWNYEGISWYGVDPNKADTTTENPSGEMPAGPAEPKPSEGETPTTPSTDGRGETGETTTGDETANPSTSPTGGSTEGNNGQNFINPNDPNYAPPAYLGGEDGSSHSNTPTAPTGPSIEEPGNSGSTHGGGVAIGDGQADTHVGTIDPVIGDKDSRDYVWTNFTHTETKAKTYKAESLTVIDKQCVGCGQTFDTSSDPNATTISGKHFDLKATAIANGTTPEMGGVYDQSTRVTHYVGDTFETKTVTDFTCWATPTGEHDPSCTNPDHVVKNDIDESNPIDINNVTVEGLEASYEWKDGGIHPNIVVKYNGQTLKRDSNYHSNGKNNYGDYHLVYYFCDKKPYWYSGSKPTIAIVGENGFKGVKYVEFEITDNNAKPNVLNATVTNFRDTWTLSKWAAGGARGWEFNEPMDIVVTLDGKTLEYGKDYTITNYHVRSNINKGETGAIDFVIEGIGNYEGEKHILTHATLV